MKYVKKKWWIGSRQNSAQ